MWRPPKAAAVADTAGATYGAVCVAAGSACDDASPVGRAPPARGAASATIRGLPAATRFSCYAYTDVAPLKPGAAPKRACSVAAAVTVTLPRTPALSQTMVSLRALGFDAFTPVAEAGGGPSVAADPAAMFRFVGGGLRLAQVATVDAAGAATLEVKCVASGAPCDAPAVGTVVRTREPATPGLDWFVVTNLTPLTLYTCYAVATGPDGATACSPPLEAFTGVAPTNLRDAAVDHEGVTSTSVVLSWRAPKVLGLPGAAMGALCTVPGATCPQALSGAAVGGVSVLVDGRTRVRVAGLPPDTAYMCWAVVSNPATLGGALCSDPVPVRTAPLAPTPPVAVTATPTSTATVALAWAPGALVGVPAAAYDGMCVAQGGACTAPPAGTAPPPAVGATVATVTGLPRGRAIRVMRRDDGCPRVQCRRGHADAAAARRVHGTDCGRHHDDIGGAGVDAADCGRRSPCHHGGGLRRSGRAVRRAPAR